jgi:hypothetical protein
MPRLVPITCPSCGASVALAPNAEVVQCQYCKTSCFVRRPDRPPPVLPPPMPGGHRTVIVDLPMAAAGVAVAHGAGVAVAVVVGVAVAMGAVAAGIHSWAQRSATEAEDDPRFGGAPGAGSGAATVAHANPVAAADPAHVDPADIIRQAVAQATKVDSGAKLISASFTEVRGGTIDLTAKERSTTAHVRFQYRRLDASKPVGQDVVEGSFYIMVHGRGFETWAHRQTPGIATDLRPEAPESRAFPLDPPACSARRAWRTAVDSGVPDDAVTELYWGKVEPFSPSKRTAWSFRVQGHDEHRREIDATSCALLRSWGLPGRAREGSAGRAPTAGPHRLPSPTASTPPAKTGRNSCACARDDLLCQMRCNSR